MNLFFICMLAISASSNLTFSQEYKQQMDITKKVIGHFEANEIEEIYDVLILLESTPSKIRG